MWNDVTSLRKFYQTNLGKVARRIIYQHLRDSWKNTSGQRILGLGYATPYLSHFEDEAEQVLAAMPAHQGVLHWPKSGGGKVILCGEGKIPLPDVSIDFVLLVHALECSVQHHRMLREVWRILIDGGQLLTIVPNQRGIWARMDCTPFGQGHPYSSGKLNYLLDDTLFTPVKTQNALFVPPIQSDVVIASAPAWEKLGQHIFPKFSGVLISESRKQMYAATPNTAVDRQGQHRTASVAEVNRVVD